MTTPPSPTAQTSRASWAFAGRLPRLATCLAALWLAAAGAAAQTPAGAPAGSGPDAGPLSLSALKSAPYRGIDGLKGSAKLSEGRWRGEPAAPGSATAAQLELVNDYVARGDLDGDGRDEAVVVLAHSPGGSGVFQYVAVLSQRKGRAVNVATALVGDRVQVRSVRVVDRRLLVDVVQAGPQDAACCPGQTAQRAWTLTGGKLKRAKPTQAPGTLSVADIGSNEWVLTHWKSDERFGGESPPTLAMADGRLAGFAGCNRFNAAVSAGASPGELQVSAPATTRRACAEAEMAVETRFTQLVARVNRFAFMPGGLVLSYRTEDGGYGALLLRQP